MLRRCGLHKIRLPMASIENIDHNVTGIEEKRAFAIEAAIVRIMKAKRRLSHQDLVTEIMMQPLLFQPNNQVYVHMHSIHM